MVSFYIIHIMYKGGEKHFKEFVTLVWHSINFTAIKNASSLFYLHSTNDGHSTQSAQLQYGQLLNGHTKAAGHQYQHQWAVAGRWHGRVVKGTGNLLLQEISKRAKFSTKQRSMGGTFFWQGCRPFVMEKLSASFFHGQPGFKILCCRKSDNIPDSLIMHWYRYHNRP